MVWIYWLKLFTRKTMGCSLISQSQVWQLGNVNAWKHFIVLLINYFYLTHSNETCHLLCQTVTGCRTEMEQVCLGKYLDEARPCTSPTLPLGSSWTKVGSKFPGDVTPLLGKKLDNFVIKTILGDIGHYLVFSFNFLLFNEIWTRPKWSRIDG